MNVGQCDCGIGLDNFIGRKAFYLVANVDILDADPVSRNPRLASADAGSTFNMAFFVNRFHNVILAQISHKSEWNRQFTISQILVCLH